MTHLQRDERVVPRASHLSPKDGVSQSLTCVSRQSVQVDLLLNSRGCVFFGKADLTTTCLVGS